MSSSLSWNHVSYTIDKTASTVVLSPRSPRLSEDTPRKILNQVYGSVSGGELCALLGPSGSGKTSLLNILAGRVVSTRGCIVESYITLNGHPLTATDIQRRVAYVTQEDTLMPTATPREALAFSARLRLPVTLTTEEINTLVEQLLGELGLESCADTRIGGPFMKGISGGQRRRVSTGIELITQPQVLLLDEPTSGLDAFSAFQMIQVLKKMTTKSIPIVCTIHQPSSEVFDMFDKVILLKDGCVVYCDRRENLAESLTQHGFNCPTHYNVADYVLTVAQTHSLEDLTETGWIEQSGFLSLKSSSDDLPLLPPLPTVSPWTRQLEALWKREWLHLLRDSSAFQTRWITTVVISCLFGAVFYHTGVKGDGNITYINEHYGAVSLVLVSTMFSASMPVMVAIPNERPMMLREVQNGTYHGIVYFLNKTLWEFPTVAVTSITQLALLYPLLALHGDYGILWIAAYTLGLTSGSIAMLFACMVNTVKDVSEYAPIVFVPNLLFTGFFLRTTNMPVYLSWIQYLCSMKYALNMVLITEFNAMNDNCQTAGALSVANCRAILNDNGVSPKGLWMNMLYMMILFLGLRCIAVAILIRR